MNLLKKGTFKNLIPDNKSKHPEPKKPSQPLSNDFAPQSSKQEVLAIMAYLAGKKSTGKHAEPTSAQFGAIQLTFR